MLFSIYKKGSGIPFRETTPSYTLLINFLYAIHLFYTNSFSVTAKTATSLNPEFPAPF